MACKPNRRFVMPTTAGILLALLTVSAVRSAPSSKVPPKAAGTPSSTAQRVTAAGSEGALGSSIYTPDSIKKENDEIILSSTANVLEAAVGEENSATFTVVFKEMVDSDDGLGLMTQDNVYPSSDPDQKTIKGALYKVSLNFVAEDGSITAIDSSWFRVVGLNGILNGRRHGEFDLLLEPEKFQIPGGQATATLQIVATRKNVVGRPKRAYVEVTVRKR